MRGEDKGKMKDYFTKGVFVLIDRLQQLSHVHMTKERRKDQITRSKQIPNEPFSFKLYHVSFPSNL